MTGCKKIIFIILIFGCCSDTAFARRGKSGQQQSSQSETEQSWTSLFKGFFSRYFSWQRTPKKDSKEDKESQSLGAEQKKYQVISIFLDNTETNRLGAVSWGLLKALYHKACPILVTQSLMRNILTCRSLNRYMFNVKYTWDLLKYRKNASVGHPASKKIIPSEIAFHDKDWTIKKVGEFGYLLIPKKLAVSGLNEDLPEEVFNFEDKSRNAPSYEENFLQALNESGVFVADSAIEWTVFVQGHGDQGTDESRKIAGLSFEKYKNFLGALEKLGCRLLISDSCYGGGVNAKLAYGENTYPYDIILHGTGDTFTWETTGTENVYSEHSNFKKFVELATQEKIDYEKTIASISDPSINFSLIRKKEEDKFKPLSENIFFLSEAEVQSVQNNKIEVPADKTVIMLESENLEYELEILSEKLLAIFMLHTRPLNSIKKITTSKVISEDVVRAFMAMSGLEANTFKIIKVTEINELKDIVVSYNPKDKNVKAFYKNKDQLYYIVKNFIERDVSKLTEHVAQVGDKKSLEAILKNYDNISVENTQLHIVTSDGDIDEVGKLLAANFNEIDPVAKFIVKNAKGQTPLHLAILNNKEVVVSKILECAKEQFITKQDREKLIEAKDNQGKTPRDYAKNNQTILEKLNNFIAGEAPENNLSNEKLDFSSLDDNASEHSTMYETD